LAQVTSTGRILPEQIGVIFGRQQANDQGGSPTRQRAGNPAANDLRSVREGKPNEPRNSLCKLDLSQNTPAGKS
jgi:hypothetical protein